MQKLHALAHRATTQGRFAQNLEMKHGEIYLK
jgi:hypothetical protein